MKYLKNNKKMLNILLILANILLLIIIIRECKLLGFCYTIINLLSPIFFGYAIAWVIKPIMLYFNKYFNEIASTSLTYILLLMILAGVGYFAIPVIIHEVKNLIPTIIDMYKKIDPNIIKNIDLSAIGTKVLTLVNEFTINLKNIALNIFYSLFISFFFLTNHQAVSRFFAKKVPTDLIYKISTNLKAFVKGTLLDTIILFGLSIICFMIIKLPYALLFAILISFTNIIPYIGPYIGGIPSVLVAFNISSQLGITVLIIIVVLQFLESSFVHPYIMSKALKINQILIMISLIFCGYFFGVFGMLISTPIISIIKTLYDYNKEHQIITLQVPHK